MTQIIAWEIIPEDASLGLPGASLAEVGDLGLYTEPLNTAEPGGPAAWGVETPNGRGGTVTLRVGVAASAQAARAAAEAAARNVAAAMSAIYLYTSDEDQTYS